MHLLAITATFLLGRLGRTSTCLARQAPIVIPRFPTTQSARMFFHMTQGFDSLHENRRSVEIAVETRTDPAGPNEWRIRDEVVRLREWGTSIVQPMRAGWRRSPLRQAGRYVSGGTSSLRTSMRSSRRYVDRHRACRSLSVRTPFLEETTLPRKS